MKKATFKFLVVFAASFVALPSLRAEEFPSGVVSKLESMFSEMASRDHVVNAVALVDANGGKTVWQKAHGLADPQKYFDNGESTYNRYSCGLKRWDVGGVEVWGHTGFWGIGMFYIPSADVSIAFAKNQVTGSPENELRGFVKGLQETGVIK